METGEEGGDRFHFRNITNSWHFIVFLDRQIDVSVNCLWLLFLPNAFFSFFFFFSFPPIFPFFFRSPSWSLEQQDKNGLNSGGKW